MLITAFPKNLSRTLRTCFLLALGLVAAKPTIAAAQLQPATPPELEQLLHQQETAWNAGDGAGFAATFSPDADFVNIRGDFFHGRPAIQRRHADIFAGPFRASHLTITVQQFVRLSLTIAIIDTTHEVIHFNFLPPGILETEPGVLRTHMKYVAVLHDGQWQFDSAQNTAILPAKLAPPPSAPK
jgi:uncharacterized protein (TIGR02246 family)